MSDQNQIVDGAPGLLPVIDGQIGQFLLRRHPVQQNDGRSVSGNLSQTGILFGIGSCQRRCIDRSRSDSLFGIQTDQLQSAILVFRRMTHPA